jgi:hypothetical protein
MGILQIFYIKFVKFLLFPPTTFLITFSETPLSYLPLPLSYFLVQNRVPSTDNPIMLLISVLYSQPYIDRKFAYPGEVVKCIER